tara:strand:+ start:323 stop:451 length:129 start_codon:yes stop_codon:yes gene_type:complete
MGFQPTRQYLNFLAFLSKKAEFSMKRVGLVLSTDLNHFGIKQ